MPKVKIGQVCIGNKNPATFKLGGMAVAETPPRPRRWDGRFKQVDKKTFVCCKEGPVDHYGIGRLPSSTFGFMTSCKVDTKGTKIIKSGDTWTLKICGLDSKNNSFVVWVGDLTSPSVLGTYDRRSSNGGTDDPTTTSITIVAK